MVKTVKYDSFLLEKEDRIRKLESAALMNGFSVADYGTNFIQFKKNRNTERYVVDIYAHSIETVFVPKNSRREVREYAMQLGKAFEQRGLGEWRILRN